MQTTVQYRAPRRSYFVSFRKLLSRLHWMTPETEQKIPNNNQIKRIMNLPTSATLANAINQRQHISEGRNIRQYKFVWMEFSESIEKSTRRRHATFALKMSTN